MIAFASNQASATQIAAHLLACDADFLPQLSTRVEIRDYAQKIAANAVTFEAWSTGVLVGLVAAYCNDQQSRIAHITSVSILREWTGKGIAACLIQRCVDHARAMDIRKVSLEVAPDNAAAVKLYAKKGFVAEPAKQPVFRMTLCLNNEGTHDQQA